MTPLLFGCLLFSGLFVVNELNQSRLDRERNATAAVTAPGQAVAAAPRRLTQQWNDADRRAS